MHVKLNEGKAVEIWLTEPGACRNLGIGVGGSVGRLGGTEGVH